jgi:hypothetical protein
VALRRVAVAAAAATVVVVVAATAAVAVATVVALVAAAATTTARGKKAATRRVDDAWKSVLARPRTRAALLHEPTPPHPASARIESRVATA